MNMRKFVLLLCLFAALPLYAQKNLLPAVRKGVAAPAGKTLTPPQMAGLGAKESVASLEFLKRLFHRQAPAAVSSAASAEKKVKTLHQQLNRMLQDKQFNKAVIENLNTLQEIRKLWIKSQAFGKNWFFKNVYKPMMTQTPFAYRNNRLVLIGSRHLLEKIEWLAQYPSQGRKNMLRMTGRHTMAALAKRLTNEKLIFLGERHFIPEIQQNVYELISQLKKLNPQRRVVVFTEFADLPYKAPPQEEELLDTYFRRVRGEQIVPLKKKMNQPINLAQYAFDLFEKLMAENIEIYPLEDRKLFLLVMMEQGDLNEVESSALAMMHRNKSWARVMESKMAEIRQTDPDALFIVYGGKGHSSWVMPYSLPKFFANERPAVVDFSFLHASPSNTLYSVWGEKEPLFRNHWRQTVYFWQGADARRLAQSAGFDYMVVLPHD